MVMICFEFGLSSASRIINMVDLLVKSIPEYKCVCQGQPVRLHGMMFL